MFKFIYLFRINDVVVNLVNFGTKIIRISLKNNAKLNMHLNFIIPNEVILSR
jgi:hypothetical protein